jgi:hypothetical protein
MSDVEKWYQQYEMIRTESAEAFEEIERLRTWYEYFEKSYKATEEEMTRRK